MMRWSLLLGLALAAGLGCREEEAPEIPEGPVSWSVAASVDKKEVQVGEDLTLTLTIEHPPTGDFIAPPASELAPFDVLESREEEVSPVVSRLQYRIAAYRLPAELEIPALEIGYREAGGDIEHLRTEPIPVRIVTSLTPDVTDIHDIKDPVALAVPRDLTLLWWLLAALLAAVLAYIIYRKLRKEPERVSAPAWTPPPLPPDVEAERALRRLAEKELVEKGELAAFYTELSEIARRYAGRRFEVAYLERTTGEILSDLEAKSVNGEPHGHLRAILEASDLVKFAKLVPDRSEAQRVFQLAEDFVAETRPRPLPEEEQPAKAEVTA